MMQAVLGRVFRQKGVLVKMLVEGLGVQAILDTTEAGAAGSFTGIRSESSGSRLSGQQTQTCSISSPVSNSNLVFLRETVSGMTAGITGLWSVGFWV